MQNALSLLENGFLNDQKPQAWADLGCGSGLFTLALNKILPGESTIYAVDKNISSFRIRDFPKDALIIPVETDFIHDALSIEPIDGILMANSLHFVKDKSRFLEKMKTLFRNEPVFLIVEYDTDRPNPWVPFPMSFLKLKTLFTSLGFRQVTKLSEYPSRYNSGTIYSAKIV